MSFITSITNAIKAKSQSEWKQTIVTKYDAFQSWMDQNGRQSFLSGLIAGVCLILFFKLILLFAVLSAIIAGTVAIVAPDKTDAKPKPDIEVEKESS